MCNNNTVSTQLSQQEQEKSLCGYMASFLEMYDDTPKTGTHETIRTHLHSIAVLCSTRQNSQMRFISHICCMTIYDMLVCCWRAVSGAYVAL